MIEVILFNTESSYIYSGKFIFLHLIKHDRSD